MAAGYSLFSNSIHTHVSPRIIPQQPVKDTATISVIPHFRWRHNAICRTIWSQTNQRRILSRKKQIWAKMSSGMSSISSLCPSNCMHVVLCTVDSLICWIAGSNCLGVLQSHCRRVSCLRALLMSWVSVCYNWVFWYSMEGQWLVCFFLGIFGCRWCVKLYSEWYL